MKIFTMKKKKKSVKKASVSVVIRRPNRQEFTSFTLSCTRDINNNRYCEMHPVAYDINDTPLAWVNAEEAYALTEYLKKARPWLLKGSNYMDII